MYIGSSPNFGALDSQTITSANGSTATFTLNQYVPDSDSIIVTVGNVVQEPTEAYTASGNSITFTENVPNGDTIVIRYLGRSVDVYTGYKRVQRFKYVATNGQQTFTGSDANSNTLAYTAQDIDVFYNGVRLDESEFTATNGTSVILGTGATTNAELVILAYKVVQLADVVPASSGGTFTGAVTFSDDVKAKFGTDGDLEIYHNNSNAFMYNATGHIYIHSGDNNKDIIFKGNDGGVTKEAGKFDMSKSGKLTLNEGFEVASNGNVTLKDGVDIVFEGDSNNTNETTLYVVDPTADRTILLPDADGTVALQNASIDLNGTELILDADGDTSITADTDDQIDFKLANTDRFKMHSIGQMEFLTAQSNRTSLYFKDADNSNTGVAGFERAIYNGSSDTEKTNTWYTQNGTHFGIATGGTTGFHMKSDTRQVVLSNNGQRDPYNSVYALTIGYNLGGNKGGMMIPTYSYYSDIHAIRIVNNDTNNGRNSEDILFQRNGSTQGYIRITGASGVSYYSSSDYRLKEDNKEIVDAIGQVKKLKPYNFKWKRSGERQDGFFAHEVDEVFDYAVAGEKDQIETKKNVVLNKEGIVIATEVSKEDFDKRLIDGDNEEASPKGETTYPEGSTWKATHDDIKPQTLDPAKLVPILTASLQEAIAKIETLEAEVKELKNG